MKKFFRIQLCCVFLTALLMVGCEVKKPDSVIPESQMEDLLYDYHMAQALGENLPYDENYKRVLYTEAVFKKHGTTEAAFDSSLVWYTRHTDIMAKMYERISKRLRTQRDEINHLIALRDKKPQITPPGDSINIWFGRQLNVLTGMPLNNRMTFTIPADSNFKKRDTLLWEMRYLFIEGKPDTAHAAIMAMQIVYENDSTISKVKRIFDSGMQHIKLYSDTLGAIKEVKGFVYYPADKKPRTLLTDKIRLMRYHCTDTLSSAAKDSLQADSIKAHKGDSVKAKTDMPADSAKVHPRLRPEELNKRSDEIRQIKPEQIETEERIQQERLQLQQDRRTHRRQQVGTSNRQRN